MLERLLVQAGGFSRPPVYRSKFPFYHENQITKFFFFLHLKYVNFGKMTWIYVSEVLRGICWLPFSCALGRRWNELGIRLFIAWNTMNVKSVHIILFCPYTRNTLSSREGTVSISPCSESFFQFTDANIVISLKLIMHRFKIRIN